MVVTASNTTAHIAGALGKPAYAMLSKGQGRLWYWAVNIFEQTKHGEWSDVVSDVGSSIAEKYRGQ
jgi:hypothetical protein